MLQKFLGMILFLFSVSLYGKTDDHKIRVLISSGDKKVSISGKNISRYIWPKKSYQSFKGNKKINFNCKARNKKNSSRPMRLAAIESSEKLLSFKGKRYNGKLHVQTSVGMNGCDVINELPIEVYLSALLSREMNSRWPIEALKAQAVAARSYAYLKIKSKEVSKNKGYNVNYDLENSEWHQVSGSFMDATKKTIKVAYRTMGEVLTFPNGKVAPVFFHSKCGGKTLLPSQVWSNKVAGYKSVNCPFCHKHGKKKWKKIIPNQDFAKALHRGLKIYGSENRTNIKQPLKLLRDKKSYRQVRFYSGDAFKSLKKSRIRSVLGREILPSNYYHIKKSGRDIELSGSGFGHGVGMCQFGAMELAKLGYNYKQILAHYFPGLKLKKVY